uniref:Uncharacterized protein n=1 Tax=Rhizophora mucronata TaxID=61149 RepID=A0A2P2PBX8_RHIMU
MFNSREPNLTCCECGASLKYAFGCLKRQLSRNHTLFFFNLLLYGAASDSEGRRRVNR